MIDRAWNVILVDHSRCFTFTERLPFALPAQIDRPFFDKLKGLDKAQVQHEIGSLLQLGAVEALMKRRDLIVSGFEKLAKEKGEGSVFTRYRPTS
jgi:hypothetical protein